MVSHQSNRNRGQRDRLFTRRRILYLTLILNLGVGIVMGCGSEETPADDGDNTIIEVTDAGQDECAQGGSIITIGLDQNGNGTIDQPVDRAVICDGESGTDGRDGSDGRDAACVDVEPLELTAAVESANIYRVDRVYTLSVEAPIEASNVEVLGDFEIEEFRQLQGTYEWDIRFLEIGKAQILAVGTDGCHFDVVRLDADIRRPPYIKIEAGLLATCGLRADGTISCWGAEQAGSLFGTGPFEGNYDLGPMIDAPEGDDFVDLSMSHGTACAQRENGALRCWSVTEDGNPILETPAGTFQQVTTATSLDVGAICGLISDQEVSCEKKDESHHYTSAQIFPDKSDPQLEYFSYNRGFLFGAPDQFVAVLEGGDAYYVRPDASEPTAEPILEGEVFEQVDSGFQSFCGINAEEYLLCDIFVVDAEDEDPLSLDYQSNTLGAQTVSSGLIYGCATFDDGSVECIGPDIHDTALVENMGIDELQQTVLDVPEGEHFVDVAVGILHACALTIDEEVVCWGDVNAQGQSFPEVTQPIQ